MLPVVARGIRNNNPLNIEHVESNKWLGLLDPPSDGRFCRFVSADYGVRAAALLLMKYQDSYGINTLAGIIEKWAPAHENNVSTYLASVSKETGFAYNAPLNLHDRAVVKPIIAAMARVETGSKISPPALNKGLALAGFAADVEIKSVMATPTMIAATVTAAPAAVVGTMSIIDAIIDNAEVIPGVVTTLGGPAAGGIALGVVTALTWGWNLYRRLRTRQETGV